MDQNVPYLGWSVVFSGCGILQKAILRTGGPTTEYHIPLCFTQTLSTYIPWANWTQLVTQDMRSYGITSSVSKSDWGALGCLDEGHCLTYFMSTWPNLESFSKKKPQLRKCLRHNSQQACLRAVLLMTDWCGRAQAHCVPGTTPRQVALEGISRPGEQSRRASQ